MEEKLQETGSAPKPSSSKTAKHSTLRGRWVGCKLDASADIVTWGQLPRSVRWALSQAVMPGIDLAGEADLDMGPSVVIGVPEAEEKKEVKHGRSPGGGRELRYEGT